MEDDDDKVGYCRPPRKHQFRKGRSGNPKGRPRRLISSDDAEIIRRLDAEVISVGDQALTRREAEIQRIFSLALKRNRKAMRLFERLAKSRPARPGGGVLHMPREYFDRQGKS